jgi:hypothetical protein
MRYVEIPPPQKPEDEDGKTREDAEALSYRVYMLKFILSDDRLSSMAAMQAAVNIRDSLNALAEDATHHEIHDHDWALVLPVVLEPNAGGGIRFAAPMLAFGNAYKHAETRKPKDDTDDQAE